MTHDSHSWSRMSRDAAPPATQTRRASFSAVSILILTLTTGATEPANAREELHPKIAKAMTLLDRGRTSKADKAFAALLEQQPELLFDVRLAQAGFWNGKEQPKLAAEHAADAVQNASNPNQKAIAVTELLVAEATLGTLPETFPASLALLRDLLSRPDSSTSDRVRIGVCTIRDLLPEDNPESLTNAAMPSGRLKYLPRLEDGSTDEAVRPEQIRDREAIPSVDQAKSMSGKVSAKIQGTIDSDGCFAKARASASGNVPGNETFNQIALAAVRGWVYRPARFNGSPVSLFFSSTITFDTGDPGKPVY